MIKLYTHKYLVDNVVNIRIYSFLIFSIVLAECIGVSQIVDSDSQEHVQKDIYTTPVNADNCIVTRIYAWELKSQSQIRSHKSVKPIFRNIANRQT